MWNKHIKVQNFCRFVPKHKYYITSFNSTIPHKQYDIAPAAWVISEELTWFPPSYSRCKLEKLVEEGGKPLPRKDFKQYSFKLLHETGDDK